MFVLFIIQIIIVFLLVVVVLMQNPSVDGLSGLTSSVNSNNTMTVPGKTNNLLSKLTYIIAALFIINNLCIMSLQSKQYSSNTTVIKEVLEESVAPVDD